MHSLSAADLHAIATKSERNNARRGLTGFLLYGAGRFYGVIEGTRRKVLARMERIATDPRHRRLVIISENSIQSRRFAGWSFSNLGEDIAPSGDPDLLDAFIVSMAGRL